MTFSQRRYSLPIISAILVATLVVGIAYAQDPDSSEEGVEVLAYKVPTMLILDGEKGKEITISALNHPRDQVFELIKMNDSGKVLARWEVKHADKIEDDSPPEEGSFSFLLRDVSGTTLAERNFSGELSGSMVKFVAGSEKRAFLQIHHDGAEQRAVVTKGSTISALSRAQDQSLMIVESDVLLEDLVLRPLLKESERKAFLQSPDGVPEVGIDGEQLFLSTRVLKPSGDERMVATLLVDGRRLELWEGEALALPLRFRRK